MKTDIYGNPIFTETDLCNIYLINTDISLRDILVEENINFSKSLELENTPNLILYKPENISVQEYDEIQQQNWFMPEEYKNLDIAKFVLDQCKNDSELQRAGHELLLFQERELFPLLCYLKYLVDTMRKNNVVWGVGRGSSVASFVLFLLGVHRINSLYYDLPIEEFLK